MLYLLLAAIIVAADRLIKVWAVRVLYPVGFMDFLPGILGLRYAENTGAAFSLFSDMRWVLITVSALSSVLIVYIILSKTLPTRLGMLGLAFVLGGAVGNLIDRVLYGYVVDLFEFEFVRFAIFNVADIFVTVGGVILCIAFLLEEAEARRREKSLNGNSDEA